MEYKITIANIVYEDYENIVNYFVEHSTQKRLQKTMKAIEVAIRKLPQNPELFQVRSEPRLFARQIRAVTVEQYYVFYHVDHDKKEIQIGRIRSQKQDNRKLKI